MEAEVFEVPEEAKASLVTGSVGSGVFTGWREGSREDSRGSFFCWNEGVKHRTDGPAAIYSNGNWQWYYQGYLHRDGGPAMKEGRTLKWYKHGQLHNENGRAIKYRPILEQSTPVIPAPSSTIFSQGITSKFGGFTVTSTPITAPTRKLKARWSVEGEDPCYALNGHVYESKREWEADVVALRLARIVNGS